MSTEAEFQLGWTTVFKAAWNHTLGNFWAFFRMLLTAGLFLSMLVGVFAFIAILFRSENLVLLFGFLMLVVVVVAFSSIAIAWHRKLLEPEKTTNPEFIQDKPLLWAYTWRALLFAIIATLAGFAVKAFLFLPASGLGQAHEFVAYWQEPPVLICVLTLFVYMLVWVWLGVRLPGIAVADSTGTLKLWKQMKPFRLHVVVTTALVFLCLLLVVATGFVVFWLVGDLMELPKLALLLLFVPGVLVCVATMLFTLSMLSLFFAALTGRFEVFKSVS